MAENDTSWRQTNRLRYILLRLANLAEAILTQAGELRRTGSSRFLLDPSML